MSLAVVVQEMVNAVTAGVMFTANPVTGGNRYEAVIDASPGLGEAVVSGAVNPDHYVVDAHRSAIVERAVGGIGKWRSVPSLAAARSAWNSPVNQELRNRSLPQ